MNQPKRGKPKLKLRVIGVTVNGKMKEKPIGELTVQERQYFQHLHRIVDEIFSEAATSYDWTWAQLAIHAGLAYQTVSNLGERTTKYPMFRTVYRLAKAVGWELVVQQPKATKKLAKAG